MKNSGYDQFFKAAKGARQSESPRRQFNLKTEPVAKTGAGAASNIRPEETLKQLLKKRSLERRRKAREKAKMPKVPLVLAIVGTMLAAWGVADPTLIERLNLPIQIGWLTDAEAQDPAPAKTAETKKEGEAKTSSGATESGTSNAASKKTWSEEELNHFSKLNERKKELDLREAELNELEEELHKQKAEVEERIRKLEEIRTQIAAVLKERVQVDEERVNKLVEFYSNMKPKQAAEIIGTLNEDLAVEVLGRMKKKNAAEIMNLLNADKAQVLSEKFTGYKR